MNQFKLPCQRFCAGVVRWLAVGACMIALCVPGSLYAQSQVITGKVVDENDQPVIGANIIVDGTTIGINSGLDGSFKLTVSPPHKTVSVMYLGYKTVKLEIGSRTYFNVKLEPDRKVIDEVVVVAYGTQKKVSVTGSVASVGNSDLKRAPVSNFSSALAGRLPGLTVTQTSGMPGAEKVDLKLRGISTTGDSSPLILIDGVPRDDLSSLDANEVENVTILKDAAATGVFGVRGANGVIYVTTRRGSVGKAAVTITADYGFQQILWRGAMKIDSWDYAALLNERAANDGKSPVYNEWQIQQFKSGSNPFFPNRDPYDEYTQMGSQWKINANVSGGTDRLQYFVNASYIDQGSVFKFLPESTRGYDPSFWLKRVSVRANIDYKITDDLKFSLNVSSYLNKVNRIVWGDGLDISDNVNFDDPGSTYILGGLNRVPPTAPGPSLPAGAVDKNGNPLPEGGWVQDGSGYQLYPRMNQGGYVRQIKTTVNTSASLDWDMKKLVKGLKIRAMFSYDLYAAGFTKATQAYNRYGFYQAKSPDEQSYWTWDHTDSSFDGIHADTKGLNFYKGGRGQGSAYKFNTQVSINYDRQFNEKHDVHVMLLGQMDNSVSNSPASLYLPYNMLYMSARATYTFDNRYTAEVNMGLNGSEQFAKENRWGLFPAFSLGWSLSEEKFFKDNIDRKWIDFFKIRASYGVVGNDRLGETRFLYMDDVRVAFNQGWVDNGTVISTLGRGNYVNTSLLGNPNLKWEKAQQQNYGLDINFLSGFSFNFDYFREKRDNILISRSTVPLAQGFSPAVLPRVNMGKVENHGYEMVLAYQKKLGKDWFIAVSGNYNFARNKVIEADEVKRQTGRGGYIYPYERTGFPIGQSWVLQVDYEDGAGNGYINTEEDLAKYGAMYDNGGNYVRSFLGQWKFIDQNGDGKIDAKDQIPYGYPSATPEITYGASLNLSWKNFDFSMQWQGVAHRQGIMVLGMFGNGHLTGDWETHAWTKERFESGERITYQAIKSGVTLASGAVNERNDYTVSDLSFVRLKNLEIGYSFPQKWIKRMGIGGIRIAVSGQNLWNTNNLRAQSMDPEQDNENQYPLTRNINFSVQLKL